MKQYDFTVIIYTRTSENIESTLESIYLQGASTEIILFDSTGNLPKEAVSKGSADIAVVDGLGMSLAESFNAGMNNANGKYICFVDDDVIYDKDSFKSVADCFAKNKVSAVSIRPVYHSPDDQFIDYIIAPKQTGLYSVYKTPNDFQFNLKGYFFDTACIAKQYHFQNEAKEECTNAFLLNYFIDHESYYFIFEKTAIYERAVECNASNYTEQYDLDWYFGYIENYILPFANIIKEQPDEKKLWLSAAVFYLLAVRFDNNDGLLNKEILNRNNFYDFLVLAGKVLECIDDNVILMKEKVGDFSLKRIMKLFLIKVKFKSLGIPYKVKIEDDLAGFDYGDDSFVGMYNMHSEKAYIKTMCYLNKTVEIDVRLASDALFGEDNIELVLKGDTEGVTWERTQVYPLIKCFGITILREYQAHIIIPVDGRNRSIQFNVRANGKDWPLGIEGSKIASKISKPYSYWKLPNKQLVFSSKEGLQIRSVGWLGWLKKEIKFEYKYFRDNADCTLRNIAERWLILSARAINKKRIWITFDKIYKAGDNGEYMFQYLKENADDINCYYVINKTSPDYERLKRDNKNILVHETLKCRIKAAMAEVILATHPNSWRYCGFHDERTLYRDLFDAKIVCIQHGLTIHKIAQYQNRMFDNTGLYCCASIYEVMNISKPIYGYKDDQIKLVGLARYDGLANNDQKQILITPTWRRNITNGGIAFNKKSHNENYKNTDFYRIYNDLINDRELLNCADKHGYIVIFLLHPAMGAQIDDYDVSENVEIVAASSGVSYEKILSEASLMVTDYSGIQFDFAYMRKPVIYYHPSDLPPQYEEGSSFSYDSMGFGPICTEHGELTNTICKAIENHCCMEEQYLARVDDFFKYNDHNNCQRIYNAVDEWCKRFD